MRLTLLAALISAVLASHASAQISAGPMGPFAVADSTGELVGGVTGEVGNDGIVAVTTPQGNGFLQLETQDTPEFRSSFATVSFVNPDCTGEAYASNDLEGSSLDGGPLLVLASNSMLYAVNGPQSSVAASSSLDATGNCQATSGSATRYPLTFIGDFAATFSPPFRYVSVTSPLNAAVPIHIGWLLAGVMLGLGLKVLRNRPTQ